MWVRDSNKVLPDKTLSREAWGAGTPLCFSPRGSSSSTSEKGSTGHSPVGFWMCPWNYSGTVRVDQSGWSVGGHSTALTWR